MASPKRSRFRHPPTGMPRTSPMRCIGCERYPIFLKGWPEVDLCITCYDQVFPDDPFRKDTEEDKQNKERQALKAKTPIC